MVNDILFDTYSLVDLFAASVPNRETRGNHGKHEAAAFGHIATAERLRYVSEPPGTPESLQRPHASRN